MGHMSKYEEDINRAKRLLNKICSTLNGHMFYSSRNLTGHVWVWNWGAPQSPYKPWQCSENWSMASCLNHWQSPLLSLPHPHSFPYLHVCGVEAMSMSSSRSFHKQLPFVHYLPMEAILSLGGKTKEKESPRLWNQGQDHLDGDWRVLGIRAWSKNGCISRWPNCGAPRTL